MLETMLARLVCDEATAKRLADSLSERFEEAATAAFEGTDGRWNLEIHFDEAPDPSAGRLRVSQVAGAESAARLGFEQIAAKDWVAASLAELKPVKAGRFTVHGAHDRGRVPVNRIGIEIEAALAFGTGHHGTTRGCLLALDRIAKARRPRKILDLGTGSGVLAHAAAPALGRPVLGSDSDSTSGRPARASARRTGVGVVSATVQGGGLARPRSRARAPFALALANILLAPLRRLAAPMARLTAPNARLVLSGLLPNQANAILAPYRMQ